MTTATRRQPRWADFPTEEYVARVERAQKLMIADGLDALIVTQKENVEYFSGFQCGHWPSKLFPPAVLILHKTRDPILCLPDFFNGTAIGSSWVDRRLLHDKPHANPRDFPKQIVAAIDELSARTGMIGLEAGEVLLPRWNLLDYEYVRDQLNSATFKPVGSLIWELRMIKSPLELDRMKLITGFTDASLQAARRGVSVGITEEEIARIVRAEMVQQGADGFSFMNIRAGLDRYPMADSVPVDRPIGEGEMLLVDVGTNFRGYTTDVAYVAHVGKPTAKHRELYDVVIRAHEAAIKMARPGVKASELYHATMTVLESANFGKFLDMVGHGIGMDTHEPPILTPYDDRELRPGMVFAIEPWLYDVTSLGFFCVEEIVAVTEDGPVVYSTIPRDDLWTVE